MSSPGFAGAGTGHDEDVAARSDRLPLGRSVSESFWVGGGPIADEFSVSGCKFQVFKGEELA